MNQFSLRTVILQPCTPHNPVATAKEILRHSSYCLSTTKGNKKRQKTATSLTGCAAYWGPWNLKIIGGHKIKGTEL